MRVLLVSGDLPFRTATATLLARRGAFAEIAGTDDEGAELAASMRPDVLVYDISGSTVPSGSQARPEAIRSRVLSSQVGVPAGFVLVGDVPEQDDAHTVLDRWGEFGALFTAIIAADLRRAPVVGTPPGPWCLRAV